MRRIVPITVDELFRIFRWKRNTENATSYFIFIPAKAYHEKRAHIIVVNYIIILATRYLSFCLQPSPHLTNRPLRHLVLLRVHISHSRFSASHPRGPFELAANEKRTKTDKLSFPLMLLTRPYREYGARCKSVFAEFVIYF